LAGEGLKSFGLGGRGKRCERVRGRGSACLLTAQARSCCWYRWAVGRWRGKIEARAQQETNTEQAPSGA
jgi:hypothetical protein